MDMTLSDIEAKADELAQRLLVAGKQEALLLGIQIEGLRDLAQIKAVGDQRAQWNASVEYTVRQTNALELAASAQTDVAQAQVASKVLGPAQADLGVPPCPSTFQRSKDEYYVCTLEYQHEGQHRGGGMWWAGPGNGKQEAEPTKPLPYCQARDIFGQCVRRDDHEGDHQAANGVDWGDNAEPTKPAADRLHELLSYLIQQSEQSLEKSNHVMQESPPWRKHLAAAKAYDDAAQKLQDILSEGGI